MSVLISDFSPENAFLRLFDSNGNEVASNHNDGLDRLPNVSDFEIPADGTYFIGISAFPNTDYDPTVAGSGVNGNARGLYTVSLELRESLPSREVRIARAVEQFMRCLLYTSPSPRDS